MQFLPTRAQYIKFFFGLQVAEYKNALAHPTRTFLLWRFPMKTTKLKGDCSIFVQVFHPSQP